MKLAKNSSNIKERTKAQSVLNAPNHTPYLVVCQQPVSSGTRKRKAEMCDSRVLPHLWTISLDNLKQ